MTTIKPLRAVLALRISDLKDESTSITRQRQRCTVLATDRGMVVVGEACDEDVSASTVPPADRPQLGAWMQRPDEFDAFVFWRQDRAVRSMTDMADLCRWARDYGKRLLFTEGGLPEVDLTSPTSEFMVMAFAFAAQMEAQAIKDRVNSWYGYARSTDRWTGGAAPFGYRTVPHPEGGKTLEIDPESARLLDEAVGRVLKGDSLNEISQDWNERKILTNIARARVGSGKPAGETYWTGHMIGRILRSEGLLGRKLEAIKDEDGKKIGMKPILVKGSYVQIAEPVLSLDLWNRVVAKLDERAISKERTLETSPLLGVVFCGQCGRRLYHNKRQKPPLADGSPGKLYRYYKCNGGKGAKPCPRAKFRGDGIDGIEALVEMLFLGKVGSVEVYRRRRVEGEDHSAELDSVNRRIRRMRDDRESGLYDGGDDEAEYTETMRWLISERKRLESMPKRDATVVAEPTGETYSEVWKRLDTEGRRRFLIDTGVRCELGYFEDSKRHTLVPGYDDESAADGPLIKLMLPEDLEQRAQAWVDGSKLPEIGPLTTVTLDPEILRRFAKIEA